jgi:hypothetical protein
MSDEQAPQEPAGTAPAASIKRSPEASGRAPLAGGQLLAAISTSIVGILRDHYGRGPMKAKTYALDDTIVVVMRGSGFTPLEQTIMDSGEPDITTEIFFIDRPLGRFGAIEITAPE